MRDANGTDDFENDSPLDGIAGKVGAPWIDEFNVEIGDAAVSWTQRRSEFGEKATANTATFPGR